MWGSKGGVSPKAPGFQEALYSTKINELKSCGYLADLKAITPIWSNRAKLGSVPRGVLHWGSDQSTYNHSWHLIHVAWNLPCQSVTVVSPGLCGWCRLHRVTCHWEWCEGEVWHSTSQLRASACPFGPTPRHSSSFWLSTCSPLEIIPTTEAAGCGTAAGCLGLVAHPRAKS